MLKTCIVDKIGFETADLTAFHQSLTLFFLLKESEPQKVAAEESGY